MTQFLNCTSLTLDQLKNKNLAISISAMVCFLLTAAILFLLIFYRACKTVLQRFFQYLTTVTLIHLLFISMDIHNELTRSSSINVVQHKSFRPILLELAVVACVILIPLTFLWVPFYNDTYGIYATSCWIQKFNTHCNKSIGAIEQIALVSILRIVMIIVIISFLILSAIFCRFARYYQDTRQAHLKTIRQTLILMCFFVLSSLIELTGLIMYAYSAISGKTVDSYSFWLVYDIAMPFSQLVIPTGFLVYLYSFRWKTIKKASEEWKTMCTLCCKACYKRLCCKKRSESSSDSMNEDFLQNFTNDVATAPTSSRVSPPSQTYFSIKYTGAFTSINDKSVTMNATYGSIADSLVV